MPHLQNKKEIKLCTQCQAPQSQYRDIGNFTYCSYYCLVKAGRAEPYPPLKRTKPFGKPRIKLKNRPTHP